MVSDATLKVLSGVHGVNKVCIRHSANPKALAFFFPGDQITAAGTSQDILRLQDPKVQVHLMAEKFPECDVLSILPSRMEAGSACYDHFLLKLTQTGEPLGYQGASLKACSQICSLGAAAGVPADLPCILIGFSKGGVVLNQVLAELSEWASKPDITNAANPSNLPRFLEAIRELHYLDAGLNCRGAYLTDPRMVSNLSRLAKPPAVHLHGTPRQWADRHRPWIRTEKDRFWELLQASGMAASQELHYEDTKPSLLMHFQILEAFQPS